MKDDSGQLTLTTWEDALTRVAGAVSVCLLPLHLSFYSLFIVIVLQQTGDIYALFFMQPNVSLFSIRVNL